VKFNVIFTISGEVLLISVVSVAYNEFTELESLLLITINE